LAEFVISHGWLQEGRSALHGFPEYWDCKDKTCPLSISQIAQFGGSVTNFG
jgi:hypothetical protein